jgi:hypothetical protein
MGRKATRAARADGKRVVTHNGEAIGNARKQPSSASLAFVVENNTRAPMHSTTWRLPHIQTVHPPDTLATKTNPKNRSWRGFQNLGTNSKVLY